MLMFFLETISLYRSSLGSYYGRSIVVNIVSFELEILYLTRSDESAPTRRALVPSALRPEPIKVSLEECKNSRHSKGSRASVSKTSCY